MLGYGVSVILCFEWFALCGMFGMVYLVYGVFGLLYLVMVCLV